MNEELQANNHNTNPQQTKQHNYQSNYYYSLKKYTPLCYKGNGIPFFLKNKDCSLSSFPCIIFMDALFIVIVALSIMNSRQSKDQQFIQTMNIISIIALVFLNISYFLTAFMNPGIIAPEDYDEQSKQNLKYCPACGDNKVENMKHCIQCRVCVQGLDHHCGFFGKCIAGPQKYAFYMFITFIFLAFICLLAQSSTLLY